MFSSIVKINYDNIFQLKQYRIHILSKCDTVGFCVGSCSFISRVRLVRGFLYFCLIFFIIQHLWIGWFILLTELLSPVSFLYISTLINPSRRTHTRTCICTCIHTDIQKYTQKREIHSSSYRNVWVSVARLIDIIILLYQLWTSVIKALVFCSCLPESRKFKFSQIKIQFIVSLHRSYFYNLKKNVIYKIYEIHDKLKKERKILRSLVLNDSLLEYFWFGLNRRRINFLNEKNEKVFSNQCRQDV